VTETGPAREPADRDELPFEAAVRGARFGVGVLSPVRDEQGRPVDFRWEYVNDAGARVLRRARDEIVGRTALDLSPDPGSMGLVDRYLGAFDSGDPFSVVHEHRDALVNGWFDLLARRVDDLLVLEFDEVTPEHLAQRRMIDAYERVPDAVLALDGDWRFTYLNAAAERILGRASDELVGRVMLDEYPYVERYRDFLREVVGLGEPASFDAVRFPAPLDRSFGVRLYPDPAGVTVYISELEPVRRLGERAAQLERLEAIATLAGGIAHDFNNLLMVISGHASLLADDLGLDHPSSEDVEAIAMAATRAAELTDELLTSGRRQVLQPVTMDLSALVADRLADWRSTAGPGIAVEVLVDDPVLVLVDRAQVVRALDHVVENAVEAMGEHGRLVVETSRSAGTGAMVLPAHLAPAGAFGVVTVTDDGAGMDAATLARAVDPFFTTKSRSGSSGLGLSVAHGAALQAGGRLAIYSEPGVGTTVRLYLPSSDDVTPTGGGPAPGADEGDDLRGNETVLVVDDNASVRALTTRVLVDFGYEVLAAADGERALEVARDRGEDIALLVVDVVMPGRSGPEFAHEARGVIGAVPVIFVSGYTEHSVIGRGVPVDGVHFLAKPFAPMELVRRIRRVLDAR
jgi:signal transduction histidine kinase